MITVHHLNNSRSQRVLWFLEELDLPYEIKHYQRDSKTMLAPDSLKEIHPLGKSPVITDGQYVIAETGAIIEYLVDSYAGDGWRPPIQTEARVDYNYWLHAAEGSYMPFLVMKLVFSRLSEPPVPKIIRPLTRTIEKQVAKEFLDPNIKRNLDLVEQTLNGQNWLLGDELSAADIMMSFPVEAAASRLDLSKAYPNINAYLARFQSRPAYQKALEKGGPYDFSH